MKIAHNLPSVHSQLYTLYGVRKTLMDLRGAAWVKLHQCYHTGIPQWSNIKVKPMKHPNLMQSFASQLQEMANVPILPSSSKTTSLNTRCYTPHNEKGFAGDLSVLSSSL